MVIDRMRESAAVHPCQGVVIGEECAMQGSLCGQQNVADVPVVFHKGGSP